MPPRSLLLILVALTATACAEKTAPGCSKDTDCKGDRICVRGECAERGAGATPTPAASADLERYADDLCACKDQSCVDSVNKAWEGKLDGTLKGMSDKDRQAFGRAMTCALKYVGK